ncbi:hypothetical protein KSI01_24350 [Kurthia sibirica]|uniref:Uncharacterized protein n=1 Tax=Kurthia sibirica TaxID=202750 RepID=A0A2U3AHI7_9BACL|nr:hypothetical protein DEX24_15390 [Kurthia sibirica]GEK34902.1 hypothetical protein KSI01_24350 [Kurthia sibirica]
MVTAVTKSRNKLCLADMNEIYTDIPFENSTQFLDELFQKEFQFREEAKSECLMKKILFSFQWNEQIMYFTLAKYTDDILQWALI